jgi:phosphatidylglycerol:prolipoprotein diacylglycerol transferase
MELAWLKWDPNSDIILIPYLGLPLTWYGIFFATGFLIGFHIFVYMLQRFFIQFPEFHLGEVDFRAWKKRPIKELSSMKYNDLTTAESLLNTPTAEPSSLNSLLAFAKRVVPSETYERVKTRQALEENYPEVFIPIKQRASIFAEKVLLYVLVATIIGARLGHILFYEKPLDYLLHPLSILKTWEGGLASHGGILAAGIAIVILHRRIQKSMPELNIWTLLDYLAVPGLFICAMIRFGNFFNQEILGAKSHQPWAIIFGHPRGGEANVPRHPAQLYEAFFYLTFFAALFTLWKRVGHRSLPGQICGLGITIGFVFRFFIEFVKTEQSVWFNGIGNFLNMGQWLSFPMIALGLFFLFRRKDQSDLGRVA